MSKKFFGLKATSMATLAALAFLTGCATPPPPAAAPDAEVMAQLASYADRATLTMQRLASIRANTSGVKVEAGEIPAGLEAPISIVWSGPIDQLVKKVAEQTSYQFGGVLGNTKTPVLVSVNVADHAAFNVLADAGAQAGSAAEIVVHPDTKKIFVKYPPATRTGGYPVQSR